MRKINVDFTKIAGKIKPLHGVNNGCRTKWFWYDTSEYFKEAGIPYSRLHDTEHPFGSGEFVDIHCIFKNFDADPDDPASYNFECTDAYLKAIVDCGTQIIYRLGESIENSAEANIHPYRYVNPPKYYLKWAKICEGIIKHYNEGWADGYHWNIKYWEIWGEPDSPALWTGTMDEYFELYCVTSKYLKKRFPTLKFGGYGTIGFYSLTRPDDASFQCEPYTKLMGYMNDFFKKAKEEASPIDFFSWHIYSSNPEEFVEFEEESVKLLEKYGFNDSETIITEWNMEAWPDTTIRKKLQGAAHAVSVFSLLQKTSVSIAAYYAVDMELSTYCGLFEYSGLKNIVNRTKTFYSFKAFNELYKLGTDVSIDVEKGLYALAAKNESEAAILITNYLSETSEAEVNIKGFASSNGIEISTYIINDKFNLDLVNKATFTDDKYVVYNKLEENNVVLLKIKKL